MILTKTRPNQDVHVMALSTSTPRKRSKKVPAVAYYRMSSGKQEASIPAQVKAVEQYAEIHGFEIIREYRDEGISGDATEKRIGFQQMIQDVSSGDIEVVLCWDQDRFGRFDPIEGGYWIKPMRDAGVRLETVAQGSIDWDDFAGRIVWTVHQEAKFSYLSDLSRNVLRGHVEAAHRGEWLGGTPPLGYVVENKRLALGDPATRNLVKRIFGDYLSGQSLRSIAEKLNQERVPAPRKSRGSGKWSGNGVRVILTNRIYIGEYSWNRVSRGKYNRVIDGRPQKTRRRSRSINDESQRICISDNHPALIDVDHFEAVQKRLSANRNRSTPSRDTQFLLTGLVVCGECGSKMHGCHDSGHRKYSCSGYNKHGAGFCRRNAVGEEKLITQICDAIQSELVSPEQLQRLRGELKRQCRESHQKGDVKQLEICVRELDAKLSVAKRRLLEVDSDMLDAVQEQVRDFRAEKQRLEMLIQDTKMPETDRLADQEHRIVQAERHLHQITEAVRLSDRRMAREFLCAAISQVELRFRAEQRGSRRFNFLDRGTITLSGSAISDLYSTTGRTSLGGITVATRSDLRSS